MKRILKVVTLKVVTLHYADGSIYQFNSTEVNVILESRLPRITTRSECGYYLLDDVVKITVDTVHVD